MDDEIITEVRAIKDAIGARFGYDLRAMFEEIKRGEAEMARSGVHFISPPEHPEDLPASAFQRTRFARRPRVEGECP